MKFLAALFPVAILIAGLLTASAQVPQVPHKMEFAGITLTIRDDARKEIQKDVDALTQSPRHHDLKVERAKTYFPIIEKVFQEEGVPDDFKYLVLQESALIADAVSVSNAVGFWQFKDFTALEMGMRVDKEIDERMNIVSASRGAAKYFKKNNIFFNNWLYALQAYQMGAGGVLRSVKDSESGAKHMEITSKTYWYVKKYLAHKVAFQEAVKGPGQVKVIMFENKTRKTLAELAEEISIDETLLKTNNKWIKSGVIPSDRTYSVLIPLVGNVNDIKVATVSNPTSSRVGSPTVSSILKESKKVNGLLTIVAKEGESHTSMAERAAVELTEFLKWNDISITDPVVAGQVYFLARKRTRAATAYHQVLPGENLWTISQNYGVQLKKLKKYNRLHSTAVKPGETLWLSAKRPKDVDYKAQTQIAEVDNKETFEWAESRPNVNVPATLTNAPEPVIINVVPSPKEQPLPPLPIDTLKEATITAVPVKVESAVPAKDSIINITVKKTEHVVQVGETLYGIAHLYNVGVMDLVNWNHLSLQAGIKPGQILRLSEGQIVTADLVIVKESSQIIHEVKSSDTLYSVARKYGVTIKEIMEWNAKTDFNVTVGEKIKIIRR